MWRCNKYSVCDIQKKKRLTKNEKIKMCLGLKEIKEMCLNVPPVCCKKIIFYDEKNDFFFIAVSFIIFD